MARLPLNILPTFRTVARLANLRAAADELHLTHSAVSQQIKLLEQQIGFEVFDRRGRRIALNAAGRTLLAAVEPALAQLDEGLRAALAGISAAEHRIRLTLLPSFAQRWLLPRIPRWREQQPQIAIELHTSMGVEDLGRSGFHAALRQGSGQWRGLEAEQLIDSPLIALGSPAAARRLAGRPLACLADEPLLGDAAKWQRYFALDGCRTRAATVASFNDAGMMLQAVEQDIGIALGRELLAADALVEGRLVRLSPLALPDETYGAYWLAYPSELRSWPPLQALRRWLFAELALSQQRLAALNPALAPPSVPAAGTSTAGAKGSRSRAPSAPPAPASRPRARAR